MVFRGTLIGEDEVRQIRRLIAQHQDRTQSDVARRVCRHFGWYRPNGALADHSFVAILRRLMSRGLIRLPPPSRGRRREISLPCDPLAELHWPASTASWVSSPLEEIVVRPIHAGEHRAWRQFIDRHHYLGHRRLVGESLCYVAFLRSEVVALIGWAAAALKSTPRDAYIGWDWDTKCRRLSRVVNNIRFLVLPGPPVPNLASQVLAANLRRLSRDWQTRYGHPVYMAETFVDSSRFHGTCYRASNWIELGRTSGWSRQRTTYRHNGIPKTVFVYPLHRRARVLLNAEDDPVRTDKEATTLTIDPARLPLEGKGGLIDVLRTVTDFRKRRGIRHSIGSVVAFAVCATLSGMRSIGAIAEWAKDLPRDLQDRLGCTRHQPASKKTFRRILGGVNAKEIDEKVGGWLAERVCAKGKGIALDGKTLRGSGDGDRPPVQLLSALLHREGIVLAQHRVADKTNEIPGVKPLLKNLSMEGAVVTGDAMHAQKATAAHIVEEKKADYLFTVKNNQPNLRQHIEDLGLGSFSPSRRNRR
jgi:hypothetical protein